MSARCRHLMLLGEMNLRDAGGLYSLDGNRSEKPGIREPRAPVPAEHAGCLADMGKAWHGIGRTAYRTLLVCLMDKAGGRVQHHLQVINGVRLVVPCLGSDIILPDAVHVVGAAQLFAVQIDVSQCIDSLKAQEEAVCFPGLTAKCEICLVGEIIVH